MRTASEWQWYRATTIDIDIGIESLPENECDADTAANCLIKGATSAVYVPVASDVLPRP